MKRSCLGTAILVAAQGYSRQVIKRYSHIGSSSIALPSGVDVVSRPALQGPNTLVSGPNGSLQLSLPTFVTLQKQDSSQIAVTIDQPDAKRQREQWGLFRTLLSNAVEGVSTGHEIPIALKGVGYRASLESGNVLNLKLGFPLPVFEKVPAGVDCVIRSQTEIMLRGVDKQVLGQFASDIRRHRKPEPYNGKVQLSSQARRDDPDSFRAAGYFRGLGDHQAKRSQEEMSRYIQLACAVYRPLTCIHRPACV